MTIDPLSSILDFNYAIEKLVEKYDMSYTEAVIEFCEKSGMETDQAATLLSGVIKDKIRREALDLNMLKKSLETAELPI